MTACGPAGDGYEIGVATVRRDVRLDPCDRPLDVDDVVGPRGPWREAVVDRHAHPAAVAQVRHQRHRLLLFVADDPPAAVNLHEDGRAVVTCGVDGEVAAAPDVELVPPPGRPV